MNKNAFKQTDLKNPLQGRSSLRGKGGDCPSVFSGSHHFGNTTITIWHFNRSLYVGKILNKSVDDVVISLKCPT